MRHHVTTISAALLLALAAAGQLHAGGLSPKEQLGKAIFFDKNLSLHRNQDCGACHGAAVGWTGPDEAINQRGTVYEGSIPGVFGNRKPPAAAYATFSPRLHRNKEGDLAGGNFWDARATGEKLGNPAADQAQIPFLNPMEQALPDAACVVYRVCTATSYPVAFEAVWGRGACMIAWPEDTDKACSTAGGAVALSALNRAKAGHAFDQIALAIAAYEASSEVSAFSSKYDAVLQGKTRLSPLERRGLALFRGKGKCKQCHTLDGRRPLLTDFTADNLGLPKNPDNPFYATQPDFIDPGMGEFLASYPRYAALAKEYQGKHKVPTLRNVDRRPREGFVKAYGHNGYFKSLKGIVHFYNTRDALPACPGPYAEAQALAAHCWPLPEVVANVNKDELGNLGLTDAEEDAIVAFMKTLSDGYLPPR